MWIWLGRAIANSRSEQNACYIRDTLQQQRKLSFFRDAVMHNYITGHTSKVLILPTLSNLALDTYGIGRHLGRAPQREALIDRNPESEPKPNAWFTPSHIHGQRSTRVECERIAIPLASVALVYKW
ncbi:hypothetical protein TWF718_001853 [Orbilia javanica]|uniref:Uncharacterized protein n=1 Tax=Orbilia javanica TaxID=47235 RepID=A0AAN8NIH3_9PEZI